MWAGQLTPSGVSVKPARARLGLRPLRGASPVPRTTLVSLLSIPSELEEPGTWPPLPPASSQDVRATLMPFFHTLFRVGSQSSGWPLSPSSITSTPPRVTCEWVLPSRGGGRLHVYRAMPPVSAAPLGNSAGPECLSAHADHPQLIPAPSCRGFVYSLSNWRGPRQ